MNLGVHGVAFEDAVGFGRPPQPVVLQVQLPAADLRQALGFGQAPLTLAQRTDQQTLALEHRPEVGLPGPLIGDVTSNREEQACGGVPGRRPCSRTAARTRSKSPAGGHTRRTTTRPSSRSRRAPRGLADERVRQLRGRTVRCTVAHNPARHVVGLASRMRPLESAATAVYSRHFRNR